MTQNLSLNISNRNMLFRSVVPPGSSRQNSIVLFESWETGLAAHPKDRPYAKSKQTQPSNLFSRKDIEKQRNSIFETPRREKLLTTPMAPIKQKRVCRKIDLKPKQLTYTYDELEVTRATDARSPVVVQTRNKTDAPARQTRNRPVRACSGAKENVNLDGAKESINFTALPPSDESEIGSRDSEKRAKNLRRPIEKSTGAENATLTKVSKRYNLRKYIVQGASSQKSADSSSKAAKTLLLSQPDDCEDWVKYLRWLQPRRDVGLWVQCCRAECQKYRYVEEYHDPSEVPEIWYCEMNSDKNIASCDVPEVAIHPELESDLIENKYNAGSIVWARVIGYPWWPAMVDDSPSTLSYYKLRKDSIIPTQYHVIFFDKKEIEYMWLSLKNIKPFLKYENDATVRQTTCRGKDYAERLEDAYKLAKSAVPMTILERLQTFSYLSRTTTPEVRNLTLDTADINNNERATGSRDNIAATRTHKQHTAKPATLEDTLSLNGTISSYTDVMQDNGIVESSQPELDMYIRSTLSNMKKQ